MSDESSEPNESKLMALIRKRAAMKSVFTKYFNYFKDLKDVIIDRQTLLIKEERLRSTFERFEIINLEVCALDPNADDADAVEIKYIDTLAKIKSLWNLYNENPSSPQRFLNNPNRLPDISVPIFDGKYSEYKPFMNLCDALVHNNTNLENVQKLFYLRRFLKGEPFDLIKYLPIVSESYHEARNLLKVRNDNKYKITNEHISTLLDIDPIVESTASNIRLFVSIVKQQLAALKNLEYNVQQWDPIVLCILTRKIDTLCNREFQLQKEKEPSVNSLIEFLESRALALENAEKAYTPYRLKHYERRSENTYPKLSQKLPTDEAVAVIYTSSFQYHEIFEGNLGLWTWA